MEKGLTMGVAGPEAWQHAVPFAQLLIVIAIVLAALIGGLVKGFRWLDDRIGERIANWSTSKDFRNAVADIVTQAAAGWNDINNRLHEEHRRGIKELRDRDAERLESVKRAHQRIDALLTGKMTP